MPCRATTYRGALTRGRRTRKRPAASVRERATARAVPGDDSKTTTSAPAIGRAATPPPDSTTPRSTCVVAAGAALGSLSVLALTGGPAAKAEPVIAVAIAACMARRPSLVFVAINAPVPPHPRCLRAYGGRRRRSPGKPFSAWLKAVTGSLPLTA